MQPDIASAFGNRQPPSNVTDITSNDTLREDALRFGSKAWTDVTAEDWINYSDAFYGMSPPALLIFPLVFWSAFTGAPTWLISL